jgi:hypothetical protein
MIRQDKEAKFPFRWLYWQKVFFALHVVNAKRFACHRKMGDAICHSLSVFFLSNSALLPIGQSHAATISCLREPGQGCMTNAFASIAEGQMAFLYV